LYSGDPRGHQLAEEAVAKLEVEPPGPDLVTAYSQVASSRMRRGAYAEVIEWADRSLSLAANLGLEEPIRALLARGTSRCLLGDREGLEEERRTLAIAIDRGMGREAAVLYNNIAVDLASLEGPREALRTVEEGIRFAEDRGIDEWALWMRTTLFNQRCALGDWDQVLAEAAPLAERLEAGGMMIALIWVRMAVARVFLFRGALDKAGPLIEWTLEAARNGGGADEKPSAFMLAALIREWAGKPDDARELLIELEQAGLQDNDNYMATVPELVRIALAVGDPRLAERLVEGIRPPPYPMHEYNGLTIRALLAEARGKVGEAADLFARAAERWGSFGDLWEGTRTLLDQGRCLVARGDTGEARRVLTEARTSFLRLGARPFVAKTDSLLERALAQGT
jgi:tetratricopeptide (TPR) repeat protein